ncbi:helix-hairpin-helix domain-containing protein [Gemella sp. zg-1178]|uniref:helix-hairpin-helix domain-containing protein n=1 Tax=Gemella sp. zg-1178 TaxID=2840372 RepID=UPI001C0433FA|nr:helix-hairpin-helix domain-containing protein [Gemella sp. zg-1178]MBU0278047.1 helix-hairpin-helix domain-containing protein [Gemella sp. zg-1178]
MKYNKEEIIVFIKENIKEIFLALFTSVIFSVIIFFLFFNNSKSIDTNKNISEYVVGNKEDLKKEEIKQEKIFVDIKGQVNKPGLYECENNTRIKEVIDMAGGLTSDADISSVNLSQKVHDQMLILIPKQGEQAQQNSSDSNKKIININRASKEELMKISGIGETKAKAIIEYRKNKGIFNKKEDITKVKGIGKGTFENIKDEIDV